MSEDLWKKYGLSLRSPGVLTRDELQEAVNGHWLVVAYLESHPNIVAYYKPDQSGEIRYFDVLTLAEKEREIEREALEKAAAKRRDNEEKQETK